MEKISAGKGKRRLILRMMIQISAHFLVHDKAMAAASHLFLAKFQNLTSEVTQYGDCLLAPYSTLNRPADGTYQKKEWTSAFF